jgi:acyl carrier protein
MNLSNRDEISEKIKVIVSNVTSIDISELCEKIRVRDELGIDSLIAMEIVALCEKQFDILIDEEQLFLVETIGDFYNLVVDICTKKPD